jgi:RHS repeat-associated protein
VAINYTGTTKRSEFTYDGLSRCVKIVEKTGNSVTSTRKFVWSGMEQCELRNASDAIIVFAYRQGQFRGGTAYYYSRDHLGSIREMFKSNGTIVARFDYDPWGRSTTVINTTLPDFNYTGLYRHSASNLDFATYRAYDPDLGRWLSRDPIAEGGGVNLYAYVHGRPATKTDRLGLQSPEPGPAPTPIPGWGPGPGFRWHGYWGGPGWVNGQWRPESGAGPLPGPSDPTYRPPQDEEDACYEEHDKCINGCPECPKIANSECTRGCDAKLHICLDNINNKTFGSRLASWLFFWLIPTYVH